MIYLKRIMSSVQGGVDEELSPKTLIVGPNASGKSRIRRSIELVLKGTASDIAGRDEVAKNIELLSLATPGQDLSVRAFLSDGTECSYLLKRKVSGKRGEKVSSSAVEPTRPASVDPATVLPLWTLRDAVLGAPGAGRKFFLGHAVREIARSDVLSRLPKALHEPYIKAVERSGIQVSRPEIDKLLAASELAGKLAGESLRETNATKKAVSEAGQGLGAPPTEAEAAEAVASTNAARKALEAAVAGYQVNSQRSDLVERLGVLNGKLGAATTRLETAKAHLAYVESEVAKLPSIEAARAAVPALSPLVKATIDAVLAHAAADPECCGVCGTIGDASREVRSGFWAARAAIARAELDRHVQATQQAQVQLNWVLTSHAKADEFLTGAKFEVQQATDNINQLTPTIVQAQELLAKVPEAPGAALTIENARAALAAAEAHERQLAESQAAWETTRKMRDSSTAAETESNKWRQLADACGEVIRDLLDAGVTAFNARVQAFLPPTDKFDLRLRDGGREVCQFGLRRGDSLYTALSGAEWARVTAALASVCGPTSEDRLAVVCPEERAFDPDTLTHVLRALGNIPQQVILESPVRPSMVPQGWTVVDTGTARISSPPPMADAPAPQRVPGFAR